MATSSTTANHRRDTLTLAAAAAFAALVTALLLAQIHAERHAAEPVIASDAAAAPDSRGVSRKLVEDVRTVEVAYLSHTGAQRNATVVLPAWYGPDNNPPLPVVVSPHGRGATGRSNAAFFGRLPAVGQFVVISPDGMGERLPNFSYGAPGQIDDLARMPEFASRALPWLRIDRRRVYAIGSSMGGQETLLLVARHGDLLAGAAALDSVTDLARRYRQIPELPCSSSCLARWGMPYGSVLQSTMAREVGGSPDEAAAAYAERSSLSQAREILASCRCSCGGARRTRSCGIRSISPERFRRAAPARPVRPRQRVRRRLGALDGDARARAPPDRAGGLRAAAGGRGATPGDRAVCAR